MEIFKFASALFISLTAAQAAFATTTVLSFDEFAHLTNLTTQYEARGVTATSAIIFDALVTPWPANTAPNVVITRSGLLSFNINPAVTGDIKTVSAYISGINATTISAYDAQGALVAQAATEGSTDNELVSITSETNPVAKVTFSESSSSFAVDTLTLSTASVPACGETANQLYTVIDTLPASEFKNNAESRRSKLLGDVERFKSLASEKVPDYRLRDQLYKLQNRTNDWINATPNRTKILDLIQKILAMVDAHQC